MMDTDFERVMERRRRFYESGGNFILTPLDEMPTQYYDTHLGEWFTSEDCNDDDDEDHWDYTNQEEADRFTADDEWYDPSDQELEERAPYPAWEEDMPLPLAPLRIVPDPANRKLHRLESWLNEQVHVRMEDTCGADQYTDVELSILQQIHQKVFDLLGED